MNTRALHLYRLIIVPIVLISFLFIITSIVSAQEASIVGDVVDGATNEPVVDADVTVKYSENDTVVATTKTDSTGYFEVTGLSPETYLVTVEAEGYIIYSQEVEVVPSPVFGENTYYLDVQLNPSLQTNIEEEEPEDSYPYILLQIGVIVTIVLVASLVMYSKIKRENLLKNAMRNRIFNYIKENPGLHYRAILNDLNLPMGVLTYHLNRLEKAQYIKSRQDGMFRRFYIKGPKTEMRFFLSDIQESIMGVIRENHGISQSKIAEKINVSRKVVNYHINILDQAGLILVESHGRESACYPVGTKTD